MLRAIILTLVLVHIFLFIVCIQSSVSVVFKITLSAIFLTIDDFLIFQDGFQLPFSMLVSLVQWHGETGVFYGRFQIFFNSSACCSVVALSHASDCKLASKSCMFRTIFEVFEDGSHCTRSGLKICWQRVKQRYLYSYSKYGTMRGGSNEIVEMLSRRLIESRRLIDIGCVQESRWRGETAQKIGGRNSYYKSFWRGDNSGIGGVGVLVAGE